MKTFNFAVFGDKIGRRRLSLCKYFCPLTFLERSVVILWSNAVAVPVGGGGFRGFA